jgi:hypothetical protein
VLAASTRRPGRPSATTIPASVTESPQSPSVRIGSYASRSLRDQLGASYDEEIADDERSAHIAEQFGEIATYLSQLDVETVWDEATESDRRLLIDEMIEAIDVHADHLEVIVRGAPNVNVTLADVGFPRHGEDWSCRRSDSPARYTYFSRDPERGGMTTVNR